MLRLVLVVLGLSFANVSWAGWSLNLGYHNPPGALAGINFLYYDVTWAFEAGVGWLEVKAKDTDTATAETESSHKDSVSVRLGGDINLKYFLANATVKPYLQGGFGAGLGAQAGKSSGAGASLGGPFGGIGLLIGSNPLYVYVALNVASTSFVQAGLGFDL